ncbi:MAG TPA: hypothetical protein VFV34_18955 [Blastocatellia bacterium]|nr:hypothetical protein [Blastocatellia bacterium]
MPVNDPEMATGVVTNERPADLQPGRILHRAIDLKQERSIVPGEYADNYNRMM